MNLWASDLARMVEASLAAFAVGGIFYSLAIFDLYYHFIIFPLLLHIVVKQQIAVQEPHRISPTIGAVASVGGAVHRRN